MTPRQRRARALASAVLPLAVFGGGGAAFLAWGHDALQGLEREVVVVFTVFALWRYGWQLLHYLRAGWYAGWHYPRLRAAADRAGADRPWPRRVFVVVPCYREEPWVSTEAMQALMHNLAALPCRATVVASVGSDQDEAVMAGVWRVHPARDRVELVMQRQSEGKRIALGHALRAVARRYEDEPDSVTVLMDGDSWLEPGALARSIPFFLAFRDLGALTTDERAYVPGRGSWYRDWFRLKFGQRQVLFQSHSLAHKVLTLTGRCSLFRTSIVVSEDFLRMIENDTLDHWLHGQFRFLMGDDKSSWFYVLRAGWSMLYLPDVTCWSLESRQAGFLRASLSLPYRWFGNTLRNNPRALALGPRRTGWFIWLVLLDQRLSMWTSLVGIAGAAVLAATKSALYLPLYVAWASVVRSLQLLPIAWHGHSVTLRTVPIMLYTQWVGALVKIRASHHLADQRWSKGKASQDSGPAGGLRRLVPTGVMVLSYAGFALALLLAHSAVRWPGVQLLAAQAAPEVSAVPPGVRANDARDDAEALQAYIDGAPRGAPVVVQLPAGQLDFMQPLLIRRDDVVLRGAGQERTRIVSHLRTAHGAVIRVEGRSGPRIARLAETLAPDGTSVVLDAATAPAAGALLWLRQPNDEALFQALGSERWRREFPWLRQALVPVAAVDGRRVRLAAPVGLAFAAQATEVRAVQPVRGLRLSDFAIEQLAGGRELASVRHHYENVAPEVAVDAISLLWTQGAEIERVSVRAAGRHPVSIEHSHGFALRDCVIDGAWNKGKGGSGYLRIARSYRGTVENCQVRGIRHIALQWSAGFNRLRDIDTEVDLNFHGGLTHHNVAEGIRFTVPPQHPWPAVYRTPADAGWAPPDGPGNEVRASSGYTAPAGRAAAPAR